MEKAYRQIDINGFKLINRGGCATVYRLDEEKVIKVFDRGSTLPMIEREYDYAKRAYEHGIPTAIPYEITDCGEHYGIVFEYIHEDDLSTVVQNDPGKIPEMTVKYADLLKKLHSTDLGGGVLDPIKPVYHEKVAAIEKWCTKEEADKLHG
ncbi:MAG: phosphotransferase, partial [Lachnospiraceae bacterium]|nr:phosphotransferase [Lachnospiraceae bacterium]